MVKKSLENVRVDFQNVRVAFQDYKGFYLAWDIAGARFHVWLDENRQLREAILYKNPPTGTTYRGVGYFETRRLKADSKENARMIAQAIEAATQNRLFEAALQEREEEEREKAAKVREAIRVGRIKSAALELYEALKALRDCASGEETEKALAQADAAIRKADNGSEITDADSHGNGYV